VLGSVHRRVSTRSQLSNFSSRHAFVSCVEPKTVYEALEDPDWLIAMHDELNNFERNKVWTLVERPKDCHNVIGTKWIFKNKQDANGIVILNKAILMAQGFSQFSQVECNPRDLRSLNSLTTSTNLIRRSIDLNKLHVCGRAS
jgi:hypothetical protein